MSGKQQLGFYGGFQKPRLHRGATSIVSAKTICNRENPMPVPITLSSADRLRRKKEAATDQRCSAVALPRWLLSDHVVRSR